MVYCCFPLVILKKLILNLKVIGVQSNHGVKYFGGPASPRVFVKRGKRAVGQGV